MSQVPKRYKEFKEQYPKVAAAYEQLGSSVHAQGPLDDKTRALIKVAISIGGKMEGAVHSHVRKALDAGASPEELRHIALLAIPTIGFPSSMAAMSWIDDVVLGTKKQMIPPHRTMGAILAGGQSRRMGRNKAFLEFQGMTLIQRIADTMKEVFEDVRMVGGNPDSTLPLPFLPDIRTNAGPLGGIHAALLSASAESVFVISCDMPLVSSHLIRYVMDSADSSRCTVVSDDGQIQPLCGVYPASLADLVERQIETGDLRMKRLLERANATILPLSSSLHWYSPILLKNINDPKEYEALLNTLPNRAR